MNKNLYTSYLVFGINMLTTYVLTYVISEKMSTEALGLVSLGSYLVNFYFIVSIAVNSMSYRFVSIEILKNNYSKASNYLSTVYFLNLLLSFIIIILSIIAIPIINKIFKISDTLLYDFQIYLVFLNSNFIILLFSSLYSVSYFALNNLYLENFRKIESLFIKSFLLISFYFFFEANIYFISLSLLISSVYLLIVSRYYFLKIFREVKISFLLIKLKYLRDLLYSGYHNSIIKLSQVILDGLDLVLANFLLTSILMGEIAVSKILLSALLSLISVVSASYLPTLTKYFSSGDNENLLFCLKQSFNKQIRFTTIPIAIFTVFGIDFIDLWIPNENSKSVYLITIASMLPIYFITPFNSMYDLFTVRNQIAEISRIMFFSSILSLFLVLLFSYLFGSNPYFIVSISAFIGLFRTLFYTVPHYCKFFEVHNFYFWKYSLKNLFFVLTSIFFALVVKFTIFLESSWLSLIFCLFVSSSISLIFNSFFTRKISKAIYVD